MHNDFMTSGSRYAPSSFSTLSSIESRPVTPAAFCFSAFH